MTGRITRWLTGGETAAPENSGAGASLDGGGTSECEANPIADRSPTETAAPENSWAGASLDGGGTSECEANPIADLPTDFCFTWTVEQQDAAVAVALDEDNVMPGACPEQQDAAVAVALGEDNVMPVALDGDMDSDWLWSELGLVVE